MTDNIEKNESIQSYMNYSEQRLMNEDSFLKQKQTQEEDPQAFDQSETHSQNKQIDPMLQQNDEEQEQEIQPIELNPLQIFESKKMEIIQNCQKSKTLYTDPDFPINNSSLYKDPQKPPEFAKDIKSVKWVRPHEISKDAKFVIDFEGDYKQGAFGESWFVGAVVIVGQMKKYNEKQNKQTQQLSQQQISQLEKLILDYDQFDECGFVAFQFFKNGEWQQVIVDTLLPFDQDSKQILFTQCANPSEFWLPLMEKAYCKLHGNYETICDGHIGEGLVDLTGGIAEINSLRDPQLSKMIENDQLWQVLLQTHKLQFFMGCMNHNETKGTKNADTGTHGILENHHYGIVDVREFPKEKLRLMRIRNVWGPEGGWNGAFSDDSEEWDKHRNLREELKLVFKSKKSDGTWWMSYQDWHQHFNKFYICKVFPESWQQYAIQGNWFGKTLGGVCPLKMPSEGLPEYIQVDTDEKWFNNPQYKIKVHKETKLYLSLMLEDEKITQQPYVACNLMVIANKARLSRIWERPPNQDIVIDMNPKGDMPAQREITQYLILKNFEGKTFGNYMVVPNMIVNETRKEEKRNFILRIFSSDKIDVAEMPETLEIQQEGSWNETSAGGKRKYDNGKENPNWCKNPQYFLNLSVSTHLKIILRRQGQVKRAKGTKIGMTICRFDKAPTNSLNIIKQQKGGGTNLVRLLKQTQQQLEAPKMVGIQRKLLIGSNEKFKQSTYFNEDVAALYFHFNPTEGPFIIIPSLDQEDRSANYKLTIYSNQEVELTKLDETKNQVHIGKWEQDISDGGCHLYEDPYEKDTSKRTWTMNPKYSLQFFEPIHITITLCIAEKNWKSKTKNTVGGMIGVYLIEKSENKITTQQIVRVPNFLPINEIQEEFDLQPTKNGYYIMPTTYQSKIHGQFILAVQGDKEFTLQALK
ncbi:unnamed protein product [Paramecium octaurelia]|uniref:Calpain catalytic domain-containing protein n=1 Tax=Paramecium octaurelia TaxID=43137 RepID=A0A8S1U8D7_PAROT|nr:unnamed protein product [Paramecium octaurelia]